MDSIMNTVLTDMSGAYIEHSAVITNFVATVHSQLKNSSCKVFPDNVQYKWNVNGENKTVIPDATINCRVHARKGNSFFDIPRFVMEVISLSTEKYDRGEKMELYRQQEAQYFLWNTITEKNKEELRLIHFPNIKITFDDLFEDIDLK